MTVHRSWLLMLVSGLVALGAVQACGGPTFVIQQYAGPSRPAETIAIIRINGKDAILWVSLDGEAAGARLPEDSRFHIEVLPGKHTLGVRGSADSPTAFVSFQAEPGRVYRPVLELGPAAQPIDPVIGGSGARIYEVDAERDTLIRDVTSSGSSSERDLGPPRPPPLPPASPSPIFQADAGSTEPASTNPPSDGGAPLSTDGAARP